MRVLEDALKQCWGVAMLLAITTGTPLIGQADLMTLVSSDGLYAIDAFVQQNEADTAHDYSTDADSGTDAVLQIDYRAAGANSQVQGLLSFNSLFGDGPNQIPLGSTINSATLSLWYVNDNGNNDIGMYTLTQDWNEGVTWNSLGGGIVEGSNASWRRILNWGSIDPLTVTVDVLDEVADWSNGANNYGWGFINSNKNGLQIAATENTTGTSGWHTPKLTVEYTAVPEPTVMGLITFTSMCMLVKRRLTKKLDEVKEPRIGIIL